MEYTEELALQCAERWGIASTTIRAWKNRGKIPDKYAGEPIPNEEAESFLRLCMTLKDGRLNIKEIERKTGVGLKTVADGDKMELTYEEFKTVRKYINEIGVMAKRARTLQTLQDLQKHPGIKPQVILRPLGRTQCEYFSHLKNTAFRSIRSYSYDVQGAVKLFYQFAEQIKV